MSSSPDRTLAIVLLALAGASCTPAAREPAAPEPEPTPAAAASTPRPETPERDYTPADVAFMTGMIGHHAQAVVMSRWVPTHGADPAVRILASRIINSQQDEIATMQRWLRDRNQPVPDTTPAAMQMEMGGMGHEMHMPGMLTAVQMKELEAARGAEFDQLFLRSMIQHHGGALTMVKELFATNGAAQDEATFKLASDINADQTTEIARMQTVLANLILGTDSR